MNAVGLPAGRKGSNRGLDTDRSRTSTGVDVARVTPPPSHRSEVWVMAVVMGAVILLPVRANGETAADAIITECDRLAAHPEDAGRQGPGIAFEQINAAAAIDRCGQAFARNPNNPHVAFTLGRAHERAGRFDEAARLYTRAANQGSALGQTVLASFYVDGLGGLPKDESEAVRLYKQAADQGFAPAQHILGLCYAEGFGGLPKDDREAARLYRLAADHGFASAQANLGFFYEVGRGGLRKDEREAARLYKLAAEQAM